MIGMRTFDRDGQSSFRDFLSVTAMRVYNWPQSIFVRPLDIHGSKPIFVVGCGHSGTSMLAAVLERTDELMLVGYESGAFFPKKGLFASKEAVRAWLNLSRQTEHSGFIEKTPKHIHCMDRIRKVVPDARFVAIARDGRDVMASFKGRGLSPEFAVERWCTDNTAVLAARDEKDVIFTTYEAIVSEPVVEVSRICDRLDVAYSPELLAGSTSGYGWIRGGTMGSRAHQTSQAIYDGRGKWRSVLSESDLETFWQKARPIMRALGYGSE